MSDKSTRPIEAINQDYAQTCAKLGSAVYQVHRLSRDIAMFHETLDSLNSEAFAAKQAEATAAAESAKSVEGEQPSV